MRRKKDEMPRDGDGNKLCQVCGDIATGFHHGVPSCEACRVFFHRCVRGSLDHVCPESNTCNVYKNKRRCCPACRLRKCYEVGMVGDNIVTKAEDTPSCSVSLSSPASTNVGHVDTRVTYTPELVDPYVPANLRQDKDEMPRDGDGNKLCQVCGDIATGFHRGVPSCEACRVFFHRCIRGSLDHVCSESNTCNVYKNKRKCCPGCRLRKCYEVGMAGDKTVTKAQDTSSCSVSLSSPAEDTSSCSVSLSSRAGDTSSCSVSLSSPAGDTSSCSVSLSSRAGDTSPWSVSLSSPASTNADQVDTTDTYPPELNYPYFLANLRQKKHEMLHGTNETGRKSAGSPRSVSDDRVMPDSTQTATKESTGLSTIYSFDTCLQADMNTRTTLIIEALSKVDLPNMEINHNHSLPPTRIHLLTSFVKIVENKLVFIVNWAKNVPGYKELTLQDQIHVIKCCWIELFLLNCAFNSMEYGGNRLVIAPDLILEKSHWSVLGMVDLMEHVAAISAQLLSHNLHNEEFLLLQAIVLANAEVRRLASFRKLKEMRQLILDSLIDTAYKYHPDNLSHVASLTLSLTHLRRASERALFYLRSIKKEGIVLFCDLLIEMLDCHLTGNTHSVAFS